MRTEELDRLLFPMAPGCMWIKKLNEMDVSLEYVTWLNDPEVTQYLECRHQKHTLESTRSYIRNLTPSYMLFGVYLEYEMIGTCSLNAIDRVNGNAYIGLMIGRKDLWGNGYGTKTINLVTDYAFKRLHLHKVSAAVYSVNPASIKAFEKAGFTCSGYLSENNIYNGRYINAALYEKLNRTGEVLN